MQTLESYPQESPLTPPHLPTTSSVFSPSLTFFRQSAREKFPHSVVHNVVDHLPMTLLNRAFLNARTLPRTLPRTHLRHPRRYTPKKDDPIDIPTSLWHQRLGPVTSFFTWFHRTQQKRPLTVQVCTSLTVYLCGDLLAQEIGGEKYDSTRTLRMLTIGAVASIPGYKWYGQHAR